MSVWYAVEQFDREILLLVNHARNEIFDWLMPRLSDFGPVFPILLLILAWRLWRGTNRERLMWAGLVAAVVLGDMICARILKPLVGRQKPFLNIDGLYLFKNPDWMITTPELRAHFHSSPSWPSCHAVNIWTATSYTAKFSPGWGLLMAVIALGVSYSRIYIGVHYPLDVTGGMAIGVLWGWMVADFVRRLKWRGKT
jgi:undecaprenyl-diphosphatase